MKANGGGQPTPDEKKNNFDILKYDIEHYLAKHKHYENTYYLIVGITAALVLFFFYPYSIAVWIGEHINNIQDKIDNVKKNINDIKKDIENQPDKLPLINTLHTSLIELDLESNHTLEDRKVLENFFIGEYNFTKDMNTLKDKLNDYSTLLQEPDKVSINTTRNLLSETDLLMANITKFFTPISDEHSKKSSEIATILGKMATPFGPIPINFFYLLYLFPAAMGAISFILIFRFKDLIGFQRVLKNNYKNKDFGLISDLAEYVKRRTPSLFDGESRLNRWIVLCIPIAIFGTSVTINIKLILLSNSIQMSLLDNAISIISIVLGGLMIGISLGYASIEFERKDYTDSKYKYRKRWF